MEDETRTCVDELDSPKDVKRRQETSLCGKGWREIWKSQGWAALQLWVIQNHKQLSCFCEGGHVLKGFFLSKINPGEKHICSKKENEHI